MTRNLLQINLKEGDANVNILADYLRSGQISSRVIEAISAFYLSLAVAESPTSTKEDIRKAEHQCLSQLKNHMQYLMDKHYRDSGITISADSFSTVTVLNSTPWAEIDRKIPTIPEQPAIPDYQKPETTGQRLTRENQEIEREIDREQASILIDEPPILVNPPGISIVDREIPMSKPDISEDDEDDEDDETPEEYWERIKQGIISHSPKVSS